MAEMCLDAQLIGAQRLWRELMRQYHCVARGRHPYTLETTARDVEVMEAITKTLEGLVDAQVYPRPGVQERW